MYYYCISFPLAIIIVSFALQFYLTSLSLSLPPSLQCNSPLKEDERAALKPVKEKSFHLISRHLVKEVISPNENVRKQVNLFTHL